jgi:hypothetical protein
VDAAEGRIGLTVNGLGVQRSCAAPAAFMPRLRRRCASIPHGRRAAMP